MVLLTPPTPTPRPNFGIDIRGISNCDSCYHRKNQADIPTLAIEYKAPHKLFRNDIVTGLREIEPDRDVIGKEGDDFSFHSMHLITAAITQLFSYMIGIGVRYGYLHRRSLYFLEDYRRQTWKWMEELVCPLNLWGKNSLSCQDTAGSHSRHIFATN